MYTQQEFYDNFHSAIGNTITQGQYNTRIDRTFERLLPFISGTSLTVNDGDGDRVINPDSITVSAIVIDHGYNDFINSIMEHPESIDFTSTDRTNFVGAFNCFVNEIRKVNSSLKIIVGGYFDYTLNSNNKPFGENLCDLQTMIAESYDFDLLDVWKYSGICYDEFVPGTSTYLEDLNAKYRTNFAPQGPWWYDSSGNLRNHFVWCPDGIHPHSDPTGKTNKRLNEVYTKLLKNILGVYKYKLVYLVDGDDYMSYDIEYGASITPETGPTKEGYTFSGWSEIPETMPAHDVEVNGSFTINKYLLTYKVDDEVFKSDSVEYNSTLTPIAEPTKEGYTFSGWSEIPETMPAHDVEVTGSFTINKYLLTYKVDDEVFKSDSVEYNSSLTPIAEPTKEGYTFSGWSEIPETMPANDVTVTGTFAINKYLLTYKVDDEVFKSDSVEYNSSLTPIAEPTKEGYTFSGWSEMSETMPAHDVTVTGTFNQTEYNIGDDTYEITGEGTVTIKGSNQTGSVEISSIVEINGYTYQVTAIGENAFKDNTEITSVTIGNGIMTIGDNAFNGCSHLKIINIGKDVNTIGHKTFANVGTASPARTRGSEASFNINCHAVSVPLTTTDAFENTPIETGLLLVEDISVDAYKASSPWSGFGTILGVNESAGINSTSYDSSRAVVYDMQGRRINHLQKGMNIIRSSDGKTKKFIRL